MTASDEHARLQLIVSLASAGDLDGAAAQASSIEDKTLAIEAWLAIGRVNANLQRLGAAIFAIENALQLDPESVRLRLEFALLLERQERHPQALRELESIAAGAESPDVLLHLARALQFAGRDSEAEMKLEAAVTRWPTEVPLHAQLVQLRWRRGADATEVLEKAIAAHPQALALRLVAADHLRNAGHAARALQLLEDGLARVPGAAAFHTSIGVLLEDLGRDAEALRHLRAAVASAPASVSARRNLLPSLLRAGATGEAMAILDSLLAQAPDDQLLLAWRATALRIAGDGAYASLHDYPRLVRCYELRPAAPFTDLRGFNEAFAGELGALHRSQQRPLAQSLRGGSQTERNLPRDDPSRPAIAAFFRMIDGPIRDYIGRLDHAGHPTDRRRRAGYRIAGSWSVQLQPGGFHTNHVHPQGWLSSAYYVEVPATTGAARAGWLKFGEPGMRDPVCPPDHYVEPRPGLLVLFPSYLWHGTVPFAEGGRRLTAAFDVVPD